MAVDNSQQIAHIEKVLASGVSQTSNDGVSVGYRSRKELVDDLKRLKADDTTGTYTTSRRVKSVNLGGF
jgi:hypothetical protein